MAFTVPEMPLAVDVYTGPWLTKVFRFSTTGNLAWGRRTSGPALLGSEIPGGRVVVAMVLLLPAGTDVRCTMQVPTPGYDVVEVPSGSGRWYGVNAVDDFAKGFPNEHRGAILVPIYENLDTVQFAGLFWPIPMP